MCAHEGTAAGPAGTMAGAITLQILVDFDNIHHLTRQKGVDHILHCVLDAAARKLGRAMPRRVTARLYGGWYDGLRLTRKAQDLVRSRYFTSHVPRCPTGFASTDKVLFRAELAKTLLSQAGDRSVTPLTYTCRTRPVSTVGFRTKFPNHRRCAIQPCFLADLAEFFRTGQCQKSDHHPDITGCVLRDEQKLVDVLLATDLLHVARGGGSAVLVSSDDDLWPAIIQALPDLNALVHVHTQDGGEREHYAPLVRQGNYLKTTLE